MVQESGKFSALKIKDTKKSKNLLSPTYRQVLVFIVATIILGFVSSIGGGYMNSYLSWARPPISALPICFFVTRMIMYALIGVAIFLVYREQSRKKYNRNIDLICFYTQLTFYFFFPLFFFRFGMLIFSSVWIGIAIVLAIITLVRFWANNAIAGILYTIYTIWLMYLFYVALGCALLA